MRVLWYAAPFTYSPAHAGTDWVTTHRVLTMDRYAQAVVRDIGVDVIDATIVTQSQWESSYDGLHYLKGRYDDRWYGKTSEALFHVTLAAVLSGCSGEASGGATG